MATLKEKIQDALNENRMLILGAEVLLGFQYEQFFQPGFGLLDTSTQRWAIAGLGLQLATIALLIAPTSFHQLVAPVGFQFIIFISQGFSTLPQDQKLLHLASLASVLISTILVMAPAAYHRLVARGAATREMYLFGQRMLLGSMVFLAFGITGDFLMVARKTLENDTLAFALGAAVLVMFLGFWFGFMLLRKRVRA